MIKLWKAKFWLGTFLTAASVISSYEIKADLTIMPAFVLAITAFLISAYLSNLIINALINFKFGRQIILFKSWPEGYWYLQTHNDENSIHNHPIKNDGIVYISYEGDSFELNVITYRLETKSISVGFSSVSDLVNLRTSDMSFSNYFTIPEGINDSKGITVGKFFRDGSSFFPNRFEGTVVLMNEGVYRRQIGHKISDNIMNSFKKKHGEFWKDELLKKGYEYIQKFESINSLK